MPKFEVMVRLTYLIEAQDKVEAARKVRTMLHEQPAFNIVEGVPRQLDNE